MLPFDVDADSLGRCPVICHSSSKAVAEFDEKVETRNERLAGL